MFGGAVVGAVSCVFAPGADLAFLSLMAPSHPVP